MGGNGEELEDGKVVVEIPKVQKKSLDANGNDLFKQF